MRTRFSGADTSARISVEAQQESKSNYFVGTNPAEWQTGVPNFARVRYAGLYRGIDLVYYGKHGTLEYDWIVSPGSDPRNIRMRFESADRLRIDGNGDLVIGAGKDEYRHKRPVMYQEIAGKRVPVAGRWTLHGHEASFRVGAYDSQEELVIDPPLIYSSYYGGNGLDYAYAIAVDSLGNTYVAGTIGSANFSIVGTEDAFVTKLSPHGSRLYTTFLGGGGADEARGVAVDVQGYIYLTGSTSSLNFPTRGAIQSATGGSGDAFVAKLGPAGTPLVYSTYLGGIANDAASGIAIDSARNAYIIGTTFSTDFPTQSPYQTKKGAQQDTFVAKINAAGSALVYSAYLGGNNVDEGNAIAVDAAGNAYVTGSTALTNFPLQSPFRSSNLASVDAFVAKINPAVSALVYSTYLGASATDYGTGIAVDS